MMRSTSLVLAIVVLAHSLAGCCNHHAHAAQAETADGCCQGHHERHGHDHHDHDHAPPDCSNPDCSKQDSSNSENEQSDDDQNDHQGRCTQGSCVFLRGDGAPAVDLDAAFTVCWATIPSDPAEQAPQLVRTAAPESDAFASPTRLHLLLQILLI